MPPSPEAESAGSRFSSTRSNGMRRELTRAFAKLGARAVPMRLSAFSLDTRRPSGIAIPGFGAAIAGPRSRPRGRPRHIRIDHAAARAVACARRTWACRSSIRRAAIELCVDKAATSFRCFNQGIPTPETFALESPRQTRALGAARIVARAAGAQAFVRRAGTRPQTDPPGVRSAGHRRDWRASIICSAISASSATAFPTAACWSRAAACSRR